MSCRGFVFAVLLVIGTSARAQPAANLDGHRAAPGPEDGLSLDAAAVGAHGGYRAQLQLVYANDPLVFEGATGFSQSERVRLVSDQLRAQLSFALGLFDRALVYAGLPIDLVMAGSTLGDLPAATGAGLGDARAGARLALAQAMPARFALQLEATFPSAAQGEQGRPGVAGDEGVTLQPELIGDLGVGPISFLFNLGARFRKDARFAGTEFTDAFVLGTGASWAILPATLRLLAEVRAETPISAPGDRFRTRLDAQLGAQFGLGGGFTVGAGGGAGLARGYGEPDARLIAVVAYDGQFGARAAAEERAEVSSAPPPTMQVEARIQNEPLEPAPPEPAPAVQPPKANPTPAPLAVAPKPAPAPAPTPLRASPPPPPPPASTAQWIATIAATPKADPDGDRVPNKSDRCPLAPGRKSARGCPRTHRVDLAEGRIELLQPPRFDTGSAKLTARMRTYVDEIAKTLLANLSMRIALEVHTADADEAAMLELSKKRAGAVRARLIERGVAAERVKAYGCGQGRPLAPNNVPWGRKKNERLELHLLDPVPSSGVHSSQGCVAAD